MFKLFAWICVVMYNVEKSDQLTIPVPQFVVKRTKSTSSLLPGDTIGYLITTKNIFWTEDADYVVRSSSLLESEKQDKDVLVGTPTIKVPDPYQNLSKTVDIEYRNYGLTTSQNGYFISFFTHHKIKCLETSSDNTMSIYVEFVMGDSPALDNGEEVTLVITVEVGNEIFLVFEDFVTKIVPGTITMPFIDLGWKVIYRSRVALHVFIRRIKRKMTNITFAFQLPIGSKFETLRIKNINPTKKFLIEANETTNLFKYYIPEFDPAGMDYAVVIVFNAQNNNLFDSTATQRNAEVRVLLTYCPTYSCSEATTKIKVEDIILTLDVIPLHKWTEKLVRLKYTKYGTCFERNNADEKIIATSTCRSSFIFRNNGTLKSNERDLYLIRDDKILDEEIAVSSYPAITYWLYYQGLLIDLIEQSSGFLMKKAPEETKVYAMTSRIDYKNNLDVVIKTNATIKLLPAWKNMDGVIIKSVLYEESTQHIYVCNPAGDLGNQHNCFYTHDLGERWTALPSIITNIIFKTTSPDYLYGKCNRAKSYCKMAYNLLNTVALEFMNEQEFTTVRFSSNGATETFNLDNVLLTELPMTPWNDGKLGVSALGVYKTDEKGNWKLFFAWGF